jgi:hypothetical protein
MRKTSKTARHKLVLSKEKLRDLGVSDALALVVAGNLVPCAGSVRSGSTLFTGD